MNETLMELDFDTLRSSECPHCTRIIFDINLDEDAKCPHCNKLRNPGIPWPNFVTWEILRQAVCDHSNTIAEPLLLCAAWESFISILMWRHLEKLGIHDSISFALLGKLNGFEEKKAMYKQLFGGKSIREVFQTNGLKDYHKAINELFSLRNKTMHGHNFYHFHAEQSLADFIKKDIMKAFIALHNYSVEFRLSLNQPCQETSPALSTK